MLTDGEAIALFRLADEPAFGFDAGEADQLFQTHAAGAGGTGEVGGYRFEYIDGLVGDPGDLAMINDTQYLLQLAGDSGLLIAQVPEPGGLAVWLLAAACFTAACRRRRPGGLPIKNYCK